MEKINLNKGAIVFYMVIILISFLYVGKLNIEEARSKTDISVVYLDK